MCDRALPGERFLGRKKGSYAEVAKLETLSPHHDAVAAPCEYASYCGGCETQHLSYEAQLRYKEQQVKELMIHVGKFSDKEPDFFSIMKPIVPCANQFRYRNKMEFSFSNHRWKPQDIWEREQVQDIWRDESLGLSPNNVHSHVGFLKHLVIRTGRDVESGKPEIMVNFVTSEYKPGLLQSLVEKVSMMTEVGSTVNNINTSVGSTSVGEMEHVLYGKPAIVEVLRGLTFQISANSFFQTNTQQAEVLYKLIEDVASLKGDGSEILLDLFCGTGTIGLTLARRAKHVYGYEVVAQAIADSQRNAEMNDICNATFVQGDLNKIDDNFGKNFPRPDVVISEKT